ncbi:MAG: single-stranded DNA-binding protein [Bergeyella sp.]
MNTIVGRITKNAEIKTVANDRQVVNFSVAVNDYYKNKQGEKIDQTTFYNCAYWISSKIAEYLTTGTLVELSGKISSSAWIGKDGEIKSGLNLNTSRIKFHGGGKKSNATGNPTTVKPQENQAFTDDLEDDLPF